MIRGVPPTSGSRILIASLCGLLSLTVLTLLSAAWTALQTAGARGRDLASRSWWAVLISFAIAAATTFALQPNLLDRLPSDPAMALFAIAVLAGLIGARLCMTVAFDLGTFVATSCMIAGLLACVGLIWLAPLFLLAAGYKIRAASLAQPACRTGFSLS